MSEKEQIVHTAEDIGCGDEHIVLAGVRGDEELPQIRFLYAPCRGHEYQLRAAERKDARGFGEVVIAADHYADLAVFGVKHRVFTVGGEVFRLVAEEMVFAVGADDLALVVDNDGVVLQRAGRAHQHGYGRYYVHAKLLCQGAHMSDGGAGQPFAKLIYPVAEGVEVVARDKKFGQAYHFCALCRGLTDESVGLEKVRILIKELVFKLDDADSYVSHFLLLSEVDQAFASSALAALCSAAFLTMKSLSHTRMSRT